MLPRNSRRASTSRLVRSAYAVVANLCEPLERRVLLSTTPVPITTPLNTGSGQVQTVLQTVAKLDDLASEIVKIDSQLSSVIGSLPLVGDGVKNAIGGANDKFKTVATTIENALKTLSGASVTGVDIQNALFTALGPSGANILPASITTASDVPIALSDTDGDTSNAEQVQMNLELKGTIFTAALNPDFNLGLPGLGLSLNGTVQAQLNYDAHIDIGVNSTDFFYIDLGKDSPEFSLSLDITTPGLSAMGNLGFLFLSASDGTAQGNTRLVGTISADLGVTGDKLTASNLGSLTSHSTLSADAEADLHLHNILTFGASANFPSLQADLDLTWKLGSVSLDSGGVTASSGSEPDVQFNNVQLDLGSFFSKFVTPIVNEIKTVLHPIQPIIDLLNTRLPIFSDIDFIKNNLGFDTNHDGKVSLLELLTKVAPGDTTFLNTVVGIDNFINSIPTIGGDLLINLGGFEMGGASNVNGVDIRSVSDLTGVSLTTFNANDIASEMTTIGNTLGGTTGAQVANFLSTIADHTTFGGGGGSNGAGLSFPLLQNPLSAFKLLLGQNVDLFTFDTPTLNLSAPMDIFFPILGPLGVELKGTIDSSDDFIQVMAHAALGYDTQGLKEFATTDHFNPSKLTDLFDGFYVDDAHTSASASLGLGAFASLNVVVFSAGVGGGINGTVTLTANDPDTDGLGADGRLRPKEILSDLQMSPLCIFDISGTIDASLDAFVRVGVDLPFVGFVGWEDDFTLASVTLLDFSEGCSTMHSSPPTLATLITTDSLLGPAGTLRLNMGTYAADRGTGDTSDDNESFIVTPISEQGDGSETVDVQAFGYVQQYSGVRKIYAEGGNGNDSIVIQPGVRSPVELWGDFNPANPDNGGATAAGNDTLAAADGPATLHGGGGDDQLTAGSGNASLYGDDGNDLLIGGPGNDYLDGGAGDDHLYGQAGNDTLLGGDGNDYLDGGDGNDSMEGGAGDDHLIGAGGNDTMAGGDGNDTLEGGIGNDSMDGGAGNDIMLGDDGSIGVDGSVNLASSPADGNDTMTAGDGNDIMYGQGGDDSMSGGAGNDYLLGNTGNDTLSGDDGNDVLIGGQGNDSLAGGTGNDTLLGDDGSVASDGNVTLNNSATDGNDSLDGGDGNDLMYGQGGNDVLTGDTGDDSLVGGQGNDSLDGGSGNDILLGDDGSVVGSTITLNNVLTDGNDTLTGGDGNDRMFGQGGNDSMFGNAGDDSMSGGDGNDSMIGGQGNDTMSGDAGNDILLGDDGTIAGTTITLNNSPTDGADSMSGGDGNDQMYGQGGNDIMTGDAGDDDLVGGQGNDLMDGGTGNDAMLGDDGLIARSGTIFSPSGSPITDGRIITAASGAGGNDTMTGGDGNDTMLGQAGDDSLSGGAGDDDMIGGQGDDSMDGGDGNDVMLGDDGAITTPGNVVPQAMPETNSILRTITLNNSATDGNDTMTGGNGNDVMYGQGGNDLMSGNAGDDYMEGNAGTDTMTGGAGDDDIIGGSSVAGTPDGADVMDGGDGNDVMLGDNGTITRPTTPIDATHSQYQRQTPGVTPGTGVGLEDNAVVRNVTLLDEDAIGGNDTMTGGAGDDIMHGGLGDDSMSGNDGNDQMYGEFGNDWMDGGAGNDCLLGDKGIIVAKIFDGSTQTTIASQGNKVTALINVKGTINWSVTLIDPTHGGNDTMQGGLGDDAMHGGAGNDIMLGDAASIGAGGAVSLLSGGGNDSLFGDLGDDRIYGGDGSDHLFGGAGNDYLDGGAGADTIYGGDGDDTLIADTKDDALIDWFGNFNQFVVPGPGYGSPTIIRSPAPQMQQFLLGLGSADGATDPDGELVVVTPPSTSNSGPGGRVN